MPRKKKKKGNALARISFSYIGKGTSMVGKYFL